jgi:RNA polymerase sigma-70 factor (ECF subfamily)
MIRGAAAGDRAARERFARAYEPVVRAGLAHRWRGTGLLGEIDDAVQEVFVDCLRDGGALSRADPDRPGGFRAYLFGITANVARRVEKARHRDRARHAGAMDAAEVAADDTGLSSALDRAFALALLEQAVLRHREKAAVQGEPGRRRVELLRPRFQEDLPIRDIAARWNEPAAKVHKEYARAREDFREALREVVGFHFPGSRAGIDAECARLLALFG